MDKKYTWTIDTELDFGGRTNGIEGLQVGLPKILKTFKEFNVKALFFISTEALDFHKSFIYDIMRDGHEIGNHGHFHYCFKEPWRQRQNMVIGQTVLKAYSMQDRYEYRAPKFHHEVYGHEYSYRDGHVGLLKKLWFKQQIPDNPIFYLHPFDLVESSESPNLFCKLWYSRPKEAYDLFRRLVYLYPGDIRLGEV